MSPKRAFYVLAAYINQYRKYLKVEKQEKAEMKNKVTQ